MIRYSYGKIICQQLHADLMNLAAQMTMLNSLQRSFGHKKYITLNLKDEPKRKANVHYNFVLKFHSPEKTQIHDQDPPARKDCNH